jgi:Rrf2 family protein
MLSQTAEYALRAVLYLANHCEGEEPVRVDTIADALGIPANYLSKTLNTLVRNRVLRSTRGPRGGFCLAVDPKRLTLARVVGPFDAIVERRFCLLGRPTCSDHTACAAHEAWKATAEKVTHFFRTTTVEDIRGSDAALAAPAGGRGRVT